MSGVPQNLIFILCSYHGRGKKLEKRELKLSTKFQKRSECKTFCYNAIYIKPAKNTSSKKLAYSKWRSVWY
jgi:hypothetical protein